MQSGEEAAEKMQIERERETRDDRLGESRNRDRGGGE